MTTELSKPETKVYEGSEIKGLFSRPQSVEVIVKNKKHGDIKFTVRPMNNDIYASMGQAMKSEGLDLEKLTQLDGLKVFADVYYPAMKVVFPYCCINPKVVDGVSTDPETLSLTDVPMDVLMDLFNEIMSISGLSDKEEQKRKN